jgi:malate dehydrogenase (oxaloacetate-decarboxylating)(NADP+)
LVAGAYTSDLHTHRWRSMPEMVGALHPARRYGIARFGFGFGFGRNRDNCLQRTGLYLSFADKGNLASVIENWQHDVEITVVTDGSRILGLGDLGINGMGIPVGKLSLYTACAGINPLKTLPITLDLGTNNQELINDPLYLGSRRPKVSADEEREFLDEMMAALTERWPSIVIQFEDFKNPFPSLERYKDTYTMFNDDIQGTGAVILAGFINAVKQSGVPAKDQRAVFLGAGSAGVGVAKQLAAFFVNEGLTEDEARKCFWLVDSKGMVTNDREGELAEHKKYFSRDDNNGEQYKSLEEVVDFVKPTILMGLSTIGGAFTPEILRKMAAMNDRPVIFPLSNPSSKSECTFEDAIKHTNGKCLFASGSPFPTLEWEGQKLVPGQGNNMCKSSISPQYFVKFGWCWLRESWCQDLASRLHHFTRLMLTYDCTRSPIQST